MIQNIFYAKKLILPSTQANVIQSLQMAAAFSASGVPSYFYPGLNLAKKRGDEPQAAKDALRNLLVQAGITVRPEEWSVLPARHKGVYSFCFQLKAAAALKKLPQALLYARDVGEASLLTGLRKLPLFGRPDAKFVFEMHEALFIQHRDLERRPGWRGTLRRERAILAAVDGLVVTNRDIADIVAAEFGYAGPVLEEPNGINENIFRPLELFTRNAPWPGENDPVNLVYAGNMQQGKGVRELVLAMRLLPERFSLKIIGRGGEAALREISGLIAAIPDGGRRVILTGHVPQGEIMEQCRGAHIFVIPQQESGGYFSPLKLNEAMALGLPVVCTPLKVFERQKELTHQSRDCTPEGLSAAVTELARLPEKAVKLRERGLQAAAGRTWRARAGRILEFANGIKARR